MNPEKVGSLILQLRKEKNLTQKQLSELLKTPKEEKHNGHSESNKAMAAISKLAETK